jgi:hypothetical protein
MINDFYKLSGNFDRFGDPEDEYLGDAEKSWMA